jgi:hypothetical protein
MGHRGPTSDPMNNVTTCFPSEAMCNASRAKPSSDDDIIGACRATQTVYCYIFSESRGMSCYSDETTCKYAKDFLGQVLPDLGPRTGCALWR